MSYPPDPVKLSSSRPAGSVGPGDRQAAPPRADEESSGGAPRRGACLDVLARFVIWELRRGDLPNHVKEAALKLAPLYPRPEPLPVRYTDGPLTISGFPIDESELIEHRKAWPHQTPEIVRDMLKEGVGYVLVTVNRR